MARWIVTWNPVSRGSIFTIIRSDIYYEYNAIYPFYSTFQRNFVCFRLAVSIQDSQLHALRRIPPISIALPPVHMHSIVTFTRDAPAGTLTVA